MLPLRGHPLGPTRKSASTLQCLPTQQVCNSGVYGLTLQFTVFRNGFSPVNIGHEETYLIRP